MIPEIPTFDFLTGRPKEKVDLKFFGLAGLAVPRCLKANFFKLKDLTINCKRKMGNSKRTSFGGDS